MWTVYHGRKGGSEEERKDRDPIVSQPTPSGRVRYGLLSCPPYPFLSLRARISPETGSRTPVYSDDVVTVVVSEGPREPHPPTDTTGTTVPPVTTGICGHGYVRVNTQTRCHRRGRGVVAGRTEGTTLRPTSPHPPPPP